MPVRSRKYAGPGSDPRTRTAHRSGQRVETVLGEYRRPGLVDRPIEPGAGVVALRPVAVDRFTAVGHPRRGMPAQGVLDVTAPVGRGLGLGVERAAPDGGEQVGPRPRYDV